MQAFNVLVSASAAERLAEARRFVASHQAGVRVLIVGASRGAADDLAREVSVALPATFGIQRLTLTQLAARTAIVALAERGVTPSTWLGAENPDARLTDFTLVTASYEAGDLKGVIGVMGPTRMPYDKIIGLVEHTSRLVEDLLE